MTQTTELIDCIECSGEGSITDSTYGTGTGKCEACDGLAEVVELRPVPVDVAPLDYRAHSVEPAKHTAEHAEWCIEQSLCAAWDAQVSPTDVLALFAPDVADDARYLLWRLLDSSAEVARCELWSETIERRMWAEQYVDTLTQLASIMRGAA